MDLRPYLFCALVGLIVSCGPQSNTQDATVSASAVYQENCSLCHGSEGDAQMSGAKDLTISKLKLDEIKTMVKKGRRLMQAYEGILSEEEIDAVSAYVLALQVE